MYDRARLSPIACCTLLLILLGLMSAGFASESDPQANRNQMVFDAMLRSASEAVERMLMSSYIPSFEEKENVEFLLEPALLVQDQLQRECSIVLYGEWPPSGEREQAGPEGDGVPDGIRLQFDVVMELFQPTGLSDPCSLMFCRNWVSADYLRVEVLWGEPHWDADIFPIYPVSLGVIQTQDEFVIFNTVHDKLHRFETPVGEEGIFRHILGYPAKGLRFTPDRHRQNRICVADLMAGTKAAFMDGRASYSLQEPKGLSASVEVQNSATGCVYRLYDAAGVMWKQVSNSCADSGQGMYLKEQTVFLPERLIPVATSSPVLVTMGDTVTELSRFLLPYYRGGRHEHIRYYPLQLKSGTICVPVEITAFNTQQNIVMRHAWVSNAVVLAPTAEKRWEGTEPTGYAQFTPMEIKWRDLYRKYWRTPADALSEVDRKELLSLKQDLSKALRNEASVGHRVKHLNMACTVDIILNDIGAMERDFESYLGSLSEAGFVRMVGYGGLDFLNLLASRWHRPEMHGVLLPMWAQATAAVSSPELLLDLCNREIRLKQEKYAVSLLNAVDKLGILADSQDKALLEQFTELRSQLQENSGE
jgi:hypothetical protein